MTLRNKELDDIVFQKQCEVIKFDRRLIDEQTYNNKMTELDEKAKIIREKLLNEFNEKRKETEARKKMEENKKVEEPKKSERKPKKDSYTMAIVNALMKKSTKNVEDVINRVDEQKPGRDRKKISQQVKMIIYLVKKQKAKRWEKYSWDEENFLLMEKE